MRTPPGYPYIAAILVRLQLHHAAQPHTRKSISNDQSVLQVKSSTKSIAFLNKASSSNASGVRRFNNDRKDLLEDKVRRNHKMITNIEAASKLHSTQPEVCLFSPPLTTLLLSLASFGISVLISVAFWRLRVYIVNCDACAGDELAPESRIVVYDNARFFMIVCVILHHYDNKGVHGPLSRFIFDPLTLRGAAIPMAGFSFISGALTKGPPSWSKLRTIINSLLLPLASYTVIIDGILSPLLEKREMQHFSSLFVQWFTQIHHTWYLLALIFWRVGALFCCLLADALGISQWFLFMAVSLAVFIVASFVPIDVAGQSRHILFLPCFALGLMLPIEKLVTSIPLNAKLAFGSCIGWIFCALLIGPVQEGVLCDWRLYNWLVGHSCISLLSWCAGLLSPLFFTVVFLMFLLCVCPRDEWWFTKIGRRGCMYVYLLHIPALKLYFWAARRIWADYPVQASYWKTSLFGNVAAIVVPISISLFLSSPPVMWLFAVVIEPAQVFGPLLRRKST